MSASLPKGSMNMIAVRRYAVLIHPSVIASQSNSLPIVGSEMFTDELTKGMRKPDMTAMSSAARLTELSVF